MQGKEREGGVEARHTHSQFWNETQEGAGEGGRGEYNRAGKELSFTADHTKLEDSSSAPPST